MRSVFLIREKQTQTWCYSAKHSAFADTLDNASIFLRKENAQDAIRGMVRGNDPAYCSGTGWSVNGVLHQGHPSAQLFQWCQSYLEPDFEVVEFNLVQC